MSQETLYSHDKIWAETQKAIKLGWDNSRVEWQRQALNAIYDLCKEKEKFSANEITARIKALPVKTHDNRAIGGAVVKAKSFGWIEKTGEYVESHPTGNSHPGNPIPLWRSKIYINL